MKNIRSTNENDGEQIVELLDSTFGPGRYARSVYRLREMRPFVEKFSYVYEQNNKILASISYCETIINFQSNGLLLGPLAVELEQKGKGFGVQLVEHTLNLINDDSNEHKEALREFLNDEIALAYIIEKNSMRNFLSHLISRYISRVNDLSILIDSEI